MTTPLWERIPYEGRDIALSRTRRVPPRWEWHVIADGSRASGTALSRDEAVSAAVRMADSLPAPCPDPPRHTHPSLPMVYLEWIDSAGMGEWADADQHRALRPHRIRTAGFLLTDAPDHVTVVQSQADPDGGTGDGQCDHAIAIPTQAITRRVDLPTCRPQRYIADEVPCPACQDGPA